MIKKIVFICLFIFLPASSAHALSLPLSAESACLINSQTGEVLYEKKAHTPLPMASTTKIMTGLLACEEDLEEIVTVSKNAASVEGSRIYLREGDELSLLDLTYGLMLSSGNDAAIAIAEHIGGDIVTFSEMMTHRARMLGMESTSFKNPSGLYDEEHFTTAYDLAKITDFALKNETFKKIVATKSYSAKLSSGNILYFKNHNKMLSLYEGADGVKTGFTKKSGRCLVSSATRDGVMLIAVTLNAPDDWADHKKMLDFGFSNLEKKCIVKKGEVLKNYGEYSFSSSEDINISTLSPLSDFEVKIFMPTSLPAPVNKGEKVGYAEFYYKDTFIKSFDIVSDFNIVKPIKKETFFEKFKKLFNLA